jgi:nucleotide-binding universal stress UspA family protein
MTTSHLAGDVMASVDFSDQTDRIVSEGMGLARASGGTLHLVHIAAGEPILAGYDKEDISPFTRQVRAGELTDEHRRLRELAEGLSAATGIDIHAVVLLGPTAQTLLEASHQLNATHMGMVGFIIFLSEASLKKSSGDRMYRFFLFPFPSRNQSLQEFR